MNRYDKLIGKRVRVHRGTTRNFSRLSEGFHLDAKWIAGDVPVGSTGTIVKGHLAIPEIAWDHGQEPKEGYVFGVSSIRCELEEITDKTHKDL